MVAPRLGKRKAAEVSAVEEGKGRWAAMTAPAAVTATSAAVAGPAYP